MEFKGTKGKWEVYNPNHIGCINVSFGKNDGFTGYVELWHHYFENKEEAKANALLISKAPEMLEMLKYFTAFPDKDFDEEFTGYTPYGMTVDIRKIKEAKQLIKEATEL